jgi:hypothetical protein
MSGSASLTAIWLKPQLRHSISISAIAPGLSGRPAEFVVKGFEVMKSGAGLSPCFQGHDPEPQGRVSAK